MPERRYGTWAGNEKGRPENPTKCVAEVGSCFSGGVHQCDRHRGHGPNGEYCKQHARMIEQGRHVFVPEEK